ncbi:unnamed protein product, partial [Iphiclides podalirius]
MSELLFGNRISRKIADLNVTIGDACLCKKRRLVTNLDLPRGFGHGAVGRGRRGRARSAAARAQLGAPPTVTLHHFGGQLAARAPRSDMAIITTLDNPKSLYRFKCARASAYAAGDMKLTSPRHIVSPSLPVLYVVK